jgi:deazaflavin-dependent oxidoreductase (nitroreductase family)
MADGDEPLPGISDFNRKVIEEFRANGGKVGPPFDGVPMLLLGTTGRRSGARHVTPLAYRPVGDRMVVFASYAGSPKHPAWYLNLLADPAVTVEVGTNRFEATATVLEGAERDAIWEQQAAEVPAFAEYQAKTTRLIPVVALDRHPA